MPLKRAGFQVRLPSNMITEVFIPTIVVLLMALAGTGVEYSRVRPVFQFPSNLVKATLAQTVLLPLLALVLVIIMRPEPELAIGLILVAASPGGALSNFYCYLGRLNISLSVTLTTISNLLAFITMPLLLSATLAFTSFDEAIKIPTGLLAWHLMLFLILPITVGMAIRNFAPTLLNRFERKLRGISLLLLLLLIVLITFQQWQTVKNIFIQASVLATLFTLLAAILGWVSYRAGSKMPENENQFVFVIEFASRNVGVTALIASSSMGRPEFTAFGAIFVAVSYTHLTLPTTCNLCRSRWSPYH